MKQKHEKQTWKRKLSTEMSEQPSVVPAKKMAKSSFGGTICGKICQDNFNLKRHMKSVH